MVTPVVLNRRTDKVPSSAVYVGRLSKWGNPFKMGIDGTREEVVALYRNWLVEKGANGNLFDVRELRGKDLVCWCRPLPCHADVLLELANDTTGELIDA